MQASAYRPEIDGLRALAVVPVVFFHAGFHFFEGGFVGVDVFFVISGYLITSIIIRELEQERFSILTFYERRARRILPALTVVMLACLPVAWMTMLPQQMKDFSQSIAATSLFSSNFLFWIETGYFAPAAELKPLLHTWSLAVEEQFYIVFPIILILAYRFRAQKRLAAIVVVLALVSFALCEWAVRNAPSANYYLSPFRAWELLIGTLCAIYAHRRARMESEFLSLAGLVLILGSAMFVGENYPYPSVYTLAPVAGTALLILACTPRTLVGRCLAVPPVVFVGLISYSAYLWHQPLFAFARIIEHKEPPATVMLALVVLTFFLAVLSWRFVETPFRDKRAIGRRGIFAASIASIGLFATLGSAGHVMKGFGNRFAEPAIVTAGQFVLPGRANGYCFYNINDVRDLPILNNQPDCRLGDADREARILLFGDSYAAQWEPFFDVLGKQNQFSMDVVTTNWCHPSAGDEWVGPSGHPSWQQCRVNRAYLAENAEHYDVIILAGAWQLVESAGQSETSIDFIEQLASKSDLIIFDTPPFYHRSSVDFGVFHPNRALVADAQTKAVAAAYWTALADRLSGVQNVLLLDHDRLFANVPDRTEAGFPYSLDGAHLSLHGSLEMVKSLAGSAILDDLLRRLDSD